MKKNFEKSTVNLRVYARYAYIIKKVGAMKNILGILLIIYGCNLKENSVSTEQIEQKCEAKFNYR